MLWTMQRTQVGLDPDLRDELRAEKVGGETYDDVVERLLTAYREPEA